MLLDILVLIFHDVDRDAAAEEEQSQLPLLVGNVFRCCFCKGNCRDRSSSSIGTVNYLRLRQHLFLSSACSEGKNIV